MEAKDSLSSVEHVREEIRVLCAEFNAAEGDHLKRVRLIQEIRGLRADLSGEVGQRLRAL
jgi:hypothetical protein